MRYAIVRIGGRQFKIEEGQTLTVDRFDNVVDEVLLFVDGDNVKIGKPLVSGVKVKTKVLEEGKVKTEIRRFRAKSRHRRKLGHKQPVTKVLIEKISLNKQNSKS